SRVSPVARSLACRATPGISADAGSNTVPFISPVVRCPAAKLELNKSSVKRTVFMVHPLLAGKKPALREAQARQRAASRNEAQARQRAASKKQSAATIGVNPQSPNSVFR